ncbi:serine/threonine-protein kinase [Nonomuraea sp. NPDC050310]|uniref:serine/threonine-protein kinase n=1 Tax=Nonomuraea sp. NPDC050310 TaxID=3154935 RepID=UPI0033EE4129
MHGEAPVLAGRYRLAQRLGEGGAGTVWRAFDLTLGREVAVKQVRMPQDPARREAFARRAIDEARAAGRLRDPAIVLVHDVVVDHGQPWIVMDLATGRSLDKVIAEYGPLPPEHVRAIGLRVLSALETAHAHGLLHQDVKPGNILLDLDGTAMLTDFGIATPMHGADDGLGSAGSPAYMAPERFNGLPAGPPSDLWSLGASLYAAVEGRSPFERPHTAAVAAAVLMQEPPFPQRAGPELGSLIMDLLAKDPARRPAAAQVRARLAGAVTGPVAVPKSRRRLLPLLAALLLVPVIALGGWYGYRALNPPPEPGRFAAAPAPCGLLTDEQAVELVGGDGRREMVGAEGCRWQGFQGASTPPRTVVVRLYPQAPGEDLSGPQRAQRLFAGERATRITRAGERSGTVTSEVVDLPGLGEAAFVQDERNLRTWRGSSTVYFRVSNLLVEVQMQVYRKGSLTPADRDAAQRAAHNVSKAL